MSNVVMINKECAYIPFLTKIYKVHGKKHDYVIWKDKRTGSFGEICDLSDLESDNFSIYKYLFMKEINMKSIPFEK